MRTTLKRLSALCAGTLLIACADFGQRAVPPQSYARADANDAYVLGRAQHMARRFEQAGESYRAALKADPAHLNARNGLATLYAEQGHFAKAIVLWQELIKDAGAASGPDSAFLFSNLGYAYILDGRYEAAREALEKACLLDPLNYRAWQHLGSALDKLGQHERAVLMQRQGAALQKHDFRADYAVVGRAGVAAIDKAVTAPAQPAQQWATTELRQSADGIIDLVRTEAPAAPVPSEPAAPLAQTLPPAALPQRRTGADKALLEISNGNGVTGMAARLARKMGDPALRVVRLSNQKRFNVRQTRVEYQSEFRAAAQRLAERFGTLTVVEVADCKLVNMRLVIGRDLVRTNFALRPLARPAQMAKAADDQAS